MTQKLTSAMWKQLLQRSTRDNMTRQAQIRQMMVGAILDGQIPVGVPLPSSRDMAEELGVARNTVVLAYQQLVDEGYLISRERSGHFVNADVLSVRLRTDSSMRPPSGPGPDWERRLRIRPSRQRSIVKPVDWQRHPYPFLYGQFDADLFPTAEWRECCMKALSVLDIRDWAPDLIMRDDEALVQQIRTRVLPRRGVWASADEVVITVGAQHALYLVADLLMGPGLQVGIEDPGYPDARNIFANRGVTLRPLPVDDHGLRVDDGLAGLDFIYATPSHQCPTTVTMPLARREALLRQAEERDLIVIEDDYESENRFDGEPIPALKSLDRGNRVIYVGSLSKTLAPGLRIGYIVAPPPLIEELRALRRLMLRHPVTYIQRAFALFLSLGHHDSLLRKLSATQRERAGLLLGAIARHLPDCSVAPLSGGASCWLRLPDGTDTAALERRARERGVLVEPGDVFFMDEPAPASYVRLGYSATPTAAIEPGIRELASVLHAG